jgi:hypothetical protein
MTKINPIWRAGLAAIAVFERPEIFPAEAGPRRLNQPLPAALNEDFVERLVSWLYCVDLWFSLPLTAWLRSSWIGMALHWQAVAGTACHSKRFIPKLDPALPVDFREGGETCASDNSQTREEAR